jgi:hypothetical protein
VYPVELRQGEASWQWLGEFRVEDFPPVALPCIEDSPPEIAICMATYQPPLELFLRQIESIREQTRGGWICLIQDDGSPSETLVAMREVLGDDGRFFLQENPRNLGFYRNFEASLWRVPSQVRFVVLSDQDDTWNPEKLEALLAPLEAGAQLCYSDCRIVDEGGKVLSETFWTRKRNEYSNFSAQVLGNTVSGAAAAFRRELLDWALPFPWLEADTSLGDKLYHDHWLAVVAMARGEMAYVDRPLYDYIQHAGADTGHFDSSTGHKRRAQVEHLPGGRRAKLARLVARERTRARLMLETLRARRALIPARQVEAEALLQADTTGLGQLAWLVGRRLRGASSGRQLGWKLWLRRLEWALRRLWWG